MAAKTRPEAPGEAAGRKRWDLVGGLEPAVQDPLELADVTLLGDAVAPLGADAGAGHVAVQVALAGPLELHLPGAGDLDPLEQTFAGLHLRHGWVSSRATRGIASPRWRAE